MPSSSLYSKAAGKGSGKTFTLKRTLFWPEVEEGKATSVHLKAARNSFWVLTPRVKMVISAPLAFLPLSDGKGKFCFQEPFLQQYKPSLNFRMGKEPKSCQAR